MIEIAIWIYVVIHLIWWALFTGIGVDLARSYSVADNIYAPKVLRVALAGPVLYALYVTAPMGRYVPIYIRMLIKGR